MVDDTLVQRKRPRFSIGFILWLLCVFAIGFSAYNRWFAKDYGERARDAQMAARNNGVKFINVWPSYYGSLPRFDEDGNVNLHDCGPYVDLTDPSMSIDDIERLLPYLRALLPNEQKFRVAIFLSAENFADQTFVVRLRKELPRCEFFARTESPGWFMR